MRLFPFKANVRETMLCLFIRGPTWDGNIPSKTGLDELVEAGLAVRGGNGYQWLNEAGMEMCFEFEFDKIKEIREQRNASRRNACERAINDIHDLPHTASIGQALMIAAQAKKEMT
jgi:hypothetical protein